VSAGLPTLAAGTYAIRFAGPALRTRMAFPPRAEKLLEAAAVILLAALVATTALTEGHGFAGLARPAGVLVGGVLAWRKAPFLVIVLAAAATPGLMSALSTTLTRGARAATASTAPFTTAITSSQSPSIVVNMASVRFGSPLSRTTRTASA